MFDIAFRTLGLADAAPVSPGPRKDLFRPNVDVEADDKVYCISVEIPGVDEKDLSLEVEPDGTLRIGGAKKGHRDRTDGNVYRAERSYGTFERVLALPDDADVDNIGATFANVVLTVRVPRKAVAQPDVRRIAIVSGDKPGVKHAA